MLARAPRSSWLRSSALEVEVGEDVAVQRQEALAEPLAEGVGGEADRAGGAARLGLDHVGEPHPFVLVLAELGRAARRAGSRRRGRSRRPRAPASHSTM